MVLALARADFHFTLRASSFTCKSTNWRACHTRCANAAPKQWITANKQPYLRIFYVDSKLFSFETRAPRTRNGITWLDFQCISPMEMDNSDVQLNLVAFCSFLFLFLSLMACMQHKRAARFKERIVSALKSCHWCDYIRPLSLSLSRSVSVSLALFHFGAYLYAMHYILHTMRAFTLCRNRAIDFLVVKFCTFGPHSLFCSLCAFFRLSVVLLESLLLFTYSTFRWCDLCNQAIHFLFSQFIRLWWAEF